MQEAPQFLQVVLQGRAGQKEAMRCVETVQSGRDLGARVLDLVAFV
jgi:hypothetical protein